MTVLEATRIGPIYRRLRLALTGVEQRERFYGRSRRIEIVTEPRDGVRGRSYLDARGYRLTRDELQVERNRQGLDSDDWVPFDRDQIVSARVIPGRTIIEEDSDAE